MNGSLLRPWPVALPVLLLAFCGHAFSARTPASRVVCDDSCELYLHTLKHSLTGMLLATPGFHYGIEGSTKFTYQERYEGKDWPLYGLTMVGVLRLDNLQMLFSRLLKENVRGDFIECGVWRGGASIFMKGMLRAHGASDRTIHLVDSFDGLPKASTSEDVDMWSEMDYLKVPLEMVQSGFKRYNLLDDGVQFHKGYFRDSLPKLRSELLSQNRKLALLRMDGDMYESTMDQLYNLMDLVSPGGCVVIDDWFIVPCQKAVKDFFQEHGMNPKIHDIDGLGSYFCIDKAVSLKHHVYEKFNAGRTA